MIENKIDTWTLDWDGCMDKCDGDYPCEYCLTDDVNRWKRDLLSDIIEKLNNHHVDDNIDYIEADVINMCIRRLGD